MQSEGQTVGHCKRHNNVFGDRWLHNNIILIMHEQCTCIQCHKNFGLIFGLSSADAFKLECDKLSFFCFVTREAGFGLTWGFIRCDTTTDDHFSLSHSDFDSPGFTVLGTPLGGNATGSRGGLTTSISVINGILSTWGTVSIFTL